jgi:hypothetical protein
MYQYKNKRQNTTTDSSPEISPPKNSSPILTINYQNYSTDPINFQTWVDIIFSKIKFSLPVTAIFIGIVAYLGGLLISQAISFEKEYIQSRAIYIGVFGISWVVGIIRYASISIHRAYEQLRPCFLIDDDSYNSVIRRWYSRMTNHSGHLLAVLGFTIVAWTAVYIAFFQPDLLQKASIQSLRPVIFEPFWYTPDHLEIKALIIAYYGLFVAFPLGTASRILIVNFFFLLDLRQFPVIPLANVVRFRLREITDLYIFISMTWFVGVGLFGIAFFNNLDVISTVFLLGLSFLGTLTFFTPQFIYRKYLLQSHRLSTQWVLESFYSRLNIGFQERQTVKLPGTNNSKSLGMDNLSEFVTASEQAQLWVYDPSDLFYFIVGQGVALGSVFLSRII